MFHRTERRARLPDSVPVGLYRATPAGVILDVNAPLVELLGYPAPRTLLARHASEFYADPADHAHVQALLGQRGVLHNHETRMRRHDGRPLWIELSLRAFKDARGRMVQEGAVVDVTERKLAEEALWASERRLRLFVEQVPAVLWGVDRDLVFTLSLGTGLEALGLRPNQVVGLTLGQYLGTDDPRHPVTAAHRRCLQGESLSYETDFGGRDFRCYTEPWREPDGTISGVIGVALDVSEHRRTEEALRNDLALRDATLDTLDDAVLLVAPDGSVAACNRSFTQLFGVAPGARTGTPAVALGAEIAPRLADPAALLARLRDGGAASDVATCDLARLADGRTLRCETRPVRIDGRPCGRVFTFRPEPAAGPAEAGRDRP